MVHHIPDGHGLLDEVVAVLGDSGGHALALQDAQDLVAGDEADLNIRVRRVEDSRK